MGPMERDGEFTISYTLPTHALYQLRGKDWLEIENILFEHPFASSDYDDVTMRGAPAHTTKQTSQGSQICTAEAPELPLELSQVCTQRPRSQARLTSVLGSCQDCKIC